MHKYNAGSNFFFNDLSFNLFLHKSWVWAKISQLHLLWNVTSNYTNGALMAKLHSAENVLISL